jgi:hypothetical protein
MNHNYPKQLLITISIFFCYCQLQAQVIDYRIGYNGATNRYEVYGRATQNISGTSLNGSQLTVVLPAAAPNATYTVTSNTGGTWSDVWRVFAPAAQPGSDFHIFSIITNTAYNFVANIEVLLFSFSIGAACEAGARMYINGVDPSAFDPGMGGVNYENLLSDPFLANDYTGVPYSNGGTACGTLPLTLLSFKGNKITSGVFLEWSTSNETNTASFDVERSYDGTNFSSIGNVLSKESPSVRNNNYSYTDNTATGSSTYIYRLKMRDRDEQYTYSPALFVKTNNITGSSFNVYPNPAKGSYLYIQPAAALHTAITVKIVDVTGSIWFNRLLTADKLQNDRFAIPVSQLPAGYYVMQIIDGKGMRVQVVKFGR